MVIEEELENVHVLVGVIDGCGLRKVWLYTFYFQFPYG